MTSSDSGSVSAYPASGVRRHQGLLAPTLVWGTLALLAVIALLEVALLRGRGRRLEDLATIALLALGAAAMVAAVRRIRGRTRIADAFFSLMLLNPLLYHYRAPPSEGLDKTLLATGLLGLMMGAIVAMRRDNVVRYGAVAGIALGLTAISKSFVMLLPALVGWFLVTGFMLAQSAVPKERVRGFIIMGLGEVSLLFFGLACILEAAAPAPAASTLFSAIVSFADFPLIVLAIVMLALGWRKGPHGTTPPHFAGMLALLVGLLTLLLNNFQAGKLPPPGTDQTVLLLCLVYTVFALHGPRRLQWVVPPVLLVLAVLYTAFR